MFCNWRALEVDSDGGDYVHVLSDSGIERNSLARIHRLVEGHVISIFRYLQGNSKSKFTFSAPLTL